MNLGALDIKGLSIDRLRAFCAVIEHGSLIQAADGDPNRQSQLSRQIKELEEALGKKLFDRVNRRLVPTKFGREVALLTNAFFGNLVELSVGDTKDGRWISIAAGESVFSGLVIPRFQEMQNALPRFRFRLHQRGTDDSVDMVRSGNCDLAVVRDTANLDGLEAVELCRTRYLLAIPRRLLPGRQKEGLAQLDGLPIAMLSGSGELRRRLHQMFDMTGITMESVAESDTIGNLQELVQTGAVAAVLPEWSAKSLASDNTAILHLAELDALDRTLVIVSHKVGGDLRPKVANAIQVLREVWRP